MATNNPTWYRPANGTSISTPAVLLYPERIEENIRRMIAIAGHSDRLRPHVKTHKIAEVVRLQLAFGIHKFKCATLAELEMVAAAGGMDILLAYPLLGLAVTEFFRIAALFPGTRFSVTVDSHEALGELGQAARKVEKRVDVFVDIDNGMHRTGIDPGKAGRLIDQVLEVPWYNFRGLQVYDGHIRESDPAERKAHCEADFEKAGRLLDELRSKGIQVEEVVCGGSPTFPIHAEHPSRTLSPGTTLLWDAGYGDAFRDMDFLHAALLAGRVISLPDDLVCLDLGHKAVASEMPHPRLKFLDLGPVTEKGHSEEHLVVSPGDKSPFLAGSPGHLGIGELVYALPRHVCPTMALHERVYVVEDGRVTGTWEVEARRRKYLLGQ